MRIAFIGFRHGHIMGLYQQAHGHARVRVVAACEDDPATAAALRQGGQVELTHERFEDVLARVECDAVAIGDYFGRRGAIAIAALRAGKHIISDKPICTSVGEWEQIRDLSRERNLRVGCLLDLRANGILRAMRTHILGGAIGEVHTITFTAQHPLMLGRRPAWYFEPGKHGGTLNDIAVHALDAIPWLTGRRIVEVVAARAWNARLPQHRHFQDAAQCMLRMDNGGGVLGDCSYLTPDSLGYNAPQYWRVTCHGAGGVIEGALDGKLHIAAAGDSAPRPVAREADRPDLCIEDFLADVAGQPARDGLSTDVVLEASRQALELQRCADARRGATRLE